MQDIGFILLHVFREIGNMIENAEHRKTYTPDVLAAIVRDAIEGRFDLEVYQSVLDREGDLRQDVLARLV